MTLTCCCQETIHRSGIFRCVKGKGLYADREPWCWTTGVYSGVVTKDIWNKKLNWGLIITNCCEQLVHQSLRLLCNVLHVRSHNLLSFSLVNCVIVSTLEPCQQVTASRSYVVATSQKSRSSTLKSDPDQRYTPRSSSYFTGNRVRVLQ